MTGLLRSLDSKQTPRPSAPEFGRPEARPGLWQKRYGTQVPLAPQLVQPSLVQPMLFLQVNAPQ